MNVSESANVVLSAKRRVKTMKDREGAASSVVRMLAITFLVLGLTDVLLLWLPPRFDSVPWEFATISQTLDSMPMIALGLALLAYGVLGDSGLSVGKARVLAGALGLGAVLMLAMGAFYATVVPPVVRSTPPEAMEGLRRALVKGSVQLFAYFTLFGLVAVNIWTRTRRVH